MRSEIDLDPNFEFKDDPDSWKERIAIVLCTMAFGILFGIAGTMIYFNVTGQLCSASPYCSVHKK